LNYVTISNPVGTKHEVMHSEEDTTQQSEESSESNLKAITHLLREGYSSQPKYLFNPKLTNNYEKGEYILTITVNSFDTNNIKLPKQVKISINIFLFNHYI
jgi:hypothetical protein